MFDKCEAGTNYRFRMLFISIGGIPLTKRNKKVKAIPGNAF